MGDPWIDKALQMQRQTECYPSVTILKAALWLEKKHAEAAHYDTAAIISLHYLVLALRKQEMARTVLREHYISQALMWRREAIQLLADAASTHA
jgi:hypothetical protein